MGKKRQLRRAMEYKYRTAPYHEGFHVSFDGIDKLRPGFHIGTRGAALGSGAFERRKEI